MGKDFGRARYLLTLLLVFVVYFVTARLGLMVGAVSTFATLVWAPTGIALMACLLGGARMWPAIALAAFLVNLSIGASPFTATGIAFGNTLEALTAAYILQRLGFFHLKLDRIKDVLALCLISAVLSTLISATIGVASLRLAG